MRILIFRGTIHLRHSNPVQCPEPERLVSHIKKYIKAMDIRGLKGTAVVWRWDKISIVIALLHMA